MRAAVQGAGPARFTPNLARPPPLAILRGHDAKRPSPASESGWIVTGNGVDPSYLLMQKRLLKRALVRPAKSTTSESRLATRSSGARHLRFSDATLDSEVVDLAG